MTALALNYSTNLLSGFIKAIRSIAASIAIGYMNGRQRQANYKVAEQMLRYAQSDYRGHTVESLTHELNTKMGLIK
jgi:hypothetical protein